MFDKAIRFRLLSCLVVVTAAVAVTVTVKVTVIIRGGLDTIHMVLIVVSSVVVRSLVTIFLSCSVCLWIVSRNLFLSQGTCSKRYAIT